VLSTVTSYQYIGCFGLEHQPSSRGWVESSHKQVFFQAGSSPISFWADLGSIFLGQVWPIKKFQKNHFEIYDFST
jgi:hypothetical protein